MMIRMNIQKTRARASVILAEALALLLAVTALSACGSVSVGDSGSAEVPAMGVTDSVTGGAEERGAEETGTDGEETGGQTWEESQGFYRAFCQKTSYEMLMEYWGDNPPEAAVVYSPVNLYLSLAMLAEMDDGAVRQEIQELLLDGLEICADFPSSMTKKEVLAEIAREKQEVIRGLSGELYRRASSGKSSLGNSLWYNEERPVRAEKLQDIGKRYHAFCQGGKMGDKAFDRQLRDWLNEQTDGKLGQQAAKDIKTSPEHVLMLLSTMLFQDKWTQPFAEDAVTQETFYGQNAYTCGNTTPEEKVDAVTCDFLHASLTARAVQTETYQAVSLPMDENYFHIILPNEGVSAEKILKEKKAADLMKLCSWGDKRQKNCEVDFSMPKLDVSSSLDLIPVLEELGVKEAFCSQGCIADGDGRFASLVKGDYAAQLYVDEVRQSSAVELDEKGCSVASYTKMGIREKGVLVQEDKLEMHCNRPFLFIITNAKGLPLFIGAVNRIEK